MNKLLFVLLFCAWPVALPAQVPPSAAAQRTQMMRVQWLVGEWSGTGWSEMGPDKRKDLIPTAIVQSKLDGLLLVFELQARNEDSSTSPIAMGFLSYEEQAKNYRWNAFTAEGRHINTEAKVETDTLQWTIQRPEGGQIR